MNNPSKSDRGLDENLTNAPTILDKNFTQAIFAAILETLELHFFVNF